MSSLPSPRRRLLLVPAVALAALVLLAGVLLFVDFDSPRLGRALLDRVADESGVRIRAESFRLNLLRGLELGGIAAEGELPGGPIAVGAEALVFRHRLAPLLRRELQFERVVVERPRIVMGPSGTAPAAGKRGRGGRDRDVARAPGEGATASAAEAGEGGRLPLTIRIGEIRLVDGSLSIVGEGGPAEIRGFDVALRDLGLDREAPGGLRGLAAAGSLRADEVVVGETRATGAEGRVRFEDGHLRVEELRFETVEGRFLVSAMDLDLGRDPFRYTFTLRGEPLDANAMVGVPGRGGLGAARLTLEARGAGAESSGLDGEGAISLDAGSLPETPALAAVDALLGRPVVVGSRYEPLEARFTVRRGRVRFEPFELVTAEFALALAGELGLDGSLDLKVEARLPRAGLDVAEVPAAVLDALTDEAGRVVVPLRITGTRERPKVRPDRDALLGGAARRRTDELKKDLEGELKKKLGRLLGRDDG